MDGYTIEHYPTVGYRINADGTVTGNDGRSIDPESLVSFEHRRIALERKQRAERQS